jgi:ribosomal protein L40E
MTKETIGYVKLEWTCPNCGSRNPGPQKTCEGCGAPQPEDVAFEQAAEEKLLTDEAEIARAKTGPDVHCAYCKARNPADAKVCTQCGANLAEGAARESGRVLGAHRDKPAPETPCPSCGALNPGTARECTQCGAPMSKPRAVTRTRPQAKSSGCGPVAYAVIGGVILLILAFIYLSTRTKDVVGRVESVLWTRSIAIEALQPVTHEAWRDEIPSGVQVGTCTDKVHHTQDDPASNAEKVCGTPYTVDSGSGFGEVVQDCQYQVYEDWCTYSVDEWQPVDRAVLEGDDLNPQWPGVQAGSGRREGERTEQYKCIFDADGKTYTYQTSDQAKFARCEIGSRWTLKVNKLGGINSLEPAD